MLCEAMLRCTVNAKLLGAGILFDGYIVYNMYLAFSRQHACPDLGFGPFALLL